MAARKDTPPTPLTPEELMIRKIEIQARTDALMIVATRLSGVHTLPGNGLAGQLITTAEPLLKYILTGDKPIERH
jgi:hypothetical protein